MTATLTAPRTDTVTPVAVEQRLAAAHSGGLLHGLNPTVLRIEIQRALRNKRSMLFSIAMPVMFFLMFGAFTSWGDQPAGKGNVAAAIMVTMALYGAIVATSGAGASISIERTTGWTRQLRLTPLGAGAWITVKAVVGLFMSALAVTAVYIAGTFTKASMPVALWIETGLLVWACSVVFAAYGLMMSYLIPGENAQQIIGFSNTLLAFLGGVFLQLTPGSTMDKIAHFTPMWGIAQIVVTPLQSQPHLNGWAVLNAVAWLVIFLAVAVWRMSKDTRRV